MPGHVKTLLHVLIKDQAVHSFGVKKGQKGLKKRFLVRGSSWEYWPDILSGILVSDIKWDSNEKYHRFGRGGPTGRIRRGRVGCVPVSVVFCYWYGSLLWPACDSGAPGGGTCTKPESCQKTCTPSDISSGTLTLPHQERKINLQREKFSRSQYV